VSGYPTSFPAARWTRATFIGWSLGFALILLFIALSGLVGLGESQFPIGLGMGVGVGWLQGRLLATQLGSNARWLRATALGLTAPFLARDLTKLMGLHLPYALPGAVVVGGLTAGLLQWRVLRAHAARSAWWIPVSMLGWTLAGSTVVFNDKVLPKTPGVIGALIYIGIILIGGIFLGATTGLALRRILVPRPSAEAPQ
jgi:hypothetical protein